MQKPALTATRRFLKSEEVEQRTSLSRSTRWRRVKEKTFPAPFRISSGRVAWLEADIEAWISQQLK